VSAIDPGLCRSCLSHALVTSARGSTFHLCKAPGKPKYPPLPVIRCDAYVKRDR
jgi:hypothetical protein